MTASALPEPEGGDSQTASDLERLPDVVARIVETMRGGRIQRLVVTRGDFHLELDARAAPVESVRTVPAGGSTLASDDEESDERPAAHVITSPMIGTFYTSPAPGEPPFVSVGDTITQGDTIGIVEAMKIMNEIAADRGGVVAEIVAGNGDTVEYGSPLVRLDPHPA